MKSAYHDLNQMQKSALAFGSIMAAGLLAAIVATMAGFDVGVFLHGGEPIPTPPSGNPVPSGYWYEFSNSDPLMMGFNTPIGGGGSETYWFESSNLDPLWAYYKYA